ncbi:MAG: sigma-70 family RNA polymerase sigma factor [Peptococcaceae bacterium]|nr:sigma-70 family RNA polymerase sigma factor [Peptococcaceae bacterium]
MSDEVLIRRMLAGDETAAEALVERYYAEILRYCLWHVPSRDVAEDAAQETFLKFLRYVERYEHRGKCRAFLYQIARTTCVDFYRRAPELPLENQPELADDGGMAEAQSAMFLRALVTRLPEGQREIVLLRFGQSLTLREIAAVTDLPLRTVQSRLRAAMKRLRKDFERGDL